MTTIRVEAMQRIVERVANHFDVPVTKIRSGGRRFNRLECEARWTTIFMIARTTDATYSETARFLNLNHTSVMHVLREIHKRPEILAEAERLSA